ncbi:hypothetical protein GE21DRAFT_7766 [Neurospora crassa]|uniref:Uncharacterized protein n=2 Tax=Neurospora crassa TaxID=5141 RepID=Q1K7U0_NEUCR|nr:hypothetical protein NCU01336 [Neurospora crassa OR74A]EAA32186.1 hypothetical protein NCU01336 [Neurospora crassa OR74A]KHE83474.1 hypothetical protein GE21DRAFT_7766 [Neurospora crassa]CAC18226.2 hypothetical protein [Neurospora crassa]|eukprot:XP_961422.1 hypothetical protein NCU01336 [Neurospora crassa OR74A]
MSQRTKPYRPGAGHVATWRRSAQPLHLSVLSKPQSPEACNPVLSPSVRALRFRSNQTRLKSSAATAIRKPHDRQLPSGKDSTTEAGAHSLSQHQDSLTIDLRDPRHHQPSRSLISSLASSVALSLNPKRTVCRDIATQVNTMGLRLYQAPVESDIQLKSAADKNSAEARSSIRRSRLQNSERVQQRRRRLAITAAINSGNAAAAAGNNHDNLRRRSPPAERSSGSNSDSNSNNAPNNAESSRDTTRDGPSRIGGMLDDQVIALFGRRLAHLHSLSQYPGALTDNEDPEPNPFLAHMTAEPPFAHMAVEPGFLSRRVPPPPPPPVEPRTSSQMNRGPPPPIRERAALRRIRDRTADRASSLYGTWGNPYPRPDAISGRRRGEQAPSVDAPQVDGLGDRNRSFSPEDLSPEDRSPERDHVWDIFTTTLTPDPLTPSSGSSFASVSASAVASQNAAAPSVGTSVTVPDAPVEVAEAEPPCESGGENSDTEGDEEDELDVNPLTRFPLAPSLNSIRRSYADVTRNDSSDDSLEILGGMGGLQRIVRNLATREDVPDEWWAEAGLSRMLSRGASGN